MDYARICRTLYLLKLQLLNSSTLNFSTFQFSTAVGLFKITEILKLIPDLEIFFLYLMPSSKTHLVASYGSLDRLDAGEEIKILKDFLSIASMRSTLSNKSESIGGAN